MKNTILLTAAFLLLAIQGICQQTALRQRNTNLTKNVAIEGYDPVSYFKGKPVKGENGIAYIYDGIMYHFANAANLETFKQNPAGYEPQYGGWCAYAMGAKGEKVEVDPETYKIASGKLYLFYNKYLTNTLKSWNKDEAGLKTKADANWQRINK